MPQGKDTIASAKLFPPYLNADSSGDAVMVLQTLLHALGYGGGVERNGQYDEATVQAVQWLQTDLGCEPDGHFGPATRAALKAKTGIVVDVILQGPEEMGTEWFGPDDDKRRWWPEIADVPADLEGDDGDD